MDFNAFSNENFDVKEWVNQTLTVSDTQEKKDYKQTMELVKMLQICVQTVNNALESTSQQILQSLPKILHDTKSLQQEAQTLKQAMKHVKEEIIQIEHDTTSSINSIEQLDTIKNQLTSAKQGLHESDNWTILINELEEIFDSKNIELISSKIIGMQNSLKLLINVADYEDKKLQLEGVKNRLEAISSPIIVQGILTHNIEQSLMFAKIFSSIGRLPDLLKYYRNCQRDILLKEWKMQLEQEQNDSFTQWLHNYYDFLLRNWHSECKWFNQVFIGESSTEAMLTIYVDVLNQLDPSLKECLDVTLKETSEKLTVLEEVKEITDQFARNLLSIISRRKSDETIDTENFLKATYSYLVNYVCNYAAYEKSHLTKQLNSLNCLKDELPETIESLGLCVNQIFNFAFDAQKRCQKITENCGICGLLIALRAYFSSYVGYFRVALRQIDRNKDLDENNWTTFQLCLSLLQQAGEVLLKIQKFEKDLTATVLDLDKSDKNIKYCQYLLDKDNFKEYRSLIKCVTEGIQLSLMDHVTNEFNKLCNDIHTTTYQVVLAPILKHLDVIIAKETWNQFDNNSTLHNDLPDYSLSPQEYITLIGQYIMTLPQHLEPFLFRENPSLTCALKSIDQEYLNAPDTEGFLAKVFLKLVARGACNNFTDKIMSICTLNQLASRQLAHDINYFGNILQDLGIDLTENLQQISLLLKIPSDQYQKESAGCSAKYVAAIRQIRNITLN